MKRIKLAGKYAKSDFTIVDDCFVLPGRRSHVRLMNSGYASICIKSKETPLHRYIIGTPKGMQTHHINGNRLDNRKANLIICDRGTNHQWIKNSRVQSSEHRGVSWFKPTKRWKASIQFKKKVYHVGYFKDINQAIDGYNKKALELYGKTARLNKLAI